MVCSISIELKNVKEGHAIDPILTNQRDCAVLSCSGIGQVHRSADTDARHFWAVRWSCYEHRQAGSRQIANVDIASRAWGISRGRAEDQVSRFDRSSTERRKRMPQNRARPVTRGWTRARVCRHWLNNMVWPGNCNRFDPRVARTPLPRPRPNF